MKPKIYFKRHKKHITDIVSSTMQAFPPSGADVSRPELWKPANWRWHLAKTMPEGVQKTPAEMSAPAKVWAVWEIADTAIVWGIGNTPNKAVLEARKYLATEGRASGEERRIKRVSGIEDIAKKQLYLLPATITVERHAIGFGGVAVGCATQVLKEKVVLRSFEQPIDFYGSL
jgi:hypothetical protein